MDVPVILTRPSHRNGLLAQRLGADASRILSLPALALAPLLTDPSAVPGPAGFDVVVFVSSYAAQVYTDLLKASPSGPRWPQRTIAATVGQASAEPLYQAGFIPPASIVHPLAHDSAQDSEALWTLLQAKAPALRNVLVLRGQAGREWLGAQFEAAGAHVQRLAVYDRSPVVWNTHELTALRDALSGPVPAIFLLTSSQSVDAVYANVQRAGLTDVWARSKFVVIHERIQARLQSILKESGATGTPSITQSAATDNDIHRAIRALIYPVLRL